MWFGHCARPREKWIFDHFSLSPVHLFLFLKLISTYLSKPSPIILLALGISIQIIKLIQNRKFILHTKPKTKSLNLTKPLQFSPLSLSV